MNQLIDTLLTDLRTLIADLGKDGGLISPSVYDTAQVLRFCPPKEGVEPALEWILRQQQPDGGWGNPAVPLSRHMPTLASVLALRTYSKINPKNIESCIEAGIQFLREHATEWQGAHIDEFPVGVEVVWPKLVEDAQRLGITWSKEVPYAKLITLGNKKRQRITQTQPKAGTAPTYSWEAWGTNATADVVDEIGSVGTSPAATAAWIHAANRCPDLANIRESARRYLKQASTVTGIDIPGVVPTVWPITYFDQLYGLYALLISGLLDHPNLRTVVESQAQSIAEGLHPTGIGASPYFINDPDDTALALMVLEATGYKVDTATTLNYFKYRDHFVTYSHEFNPSILTNAHAVHALAYAGEQIDQSRQFLLKRQLSNGKWPSGKWHSSWLYITLEVILALRHFEDTKALELACYAVQSDQNKDGGWGLKGKSNSLETACGVLILHTLRQHHFFKQQTLNALRRGYQWLLDDYQPFTLNDVRRWICKELYSEYRVDRAFELSAMLAVALEEASS